METEAATIPLEYFTTGSSIIIVVLILYTIITYKNRIGLIQNLIKEKEKGNFTAQDKSAVEESLVQAQILRLKIVKLSKTIYPAFILVAGVFFAFFDMKEALTHINVVVVAFLYLHILKTNVTSYINQMQLLG